MSSLITRRTLEPLKALLSLVSIKNFINLLLGQGTNVLVALIVTPYLFQTLGEENYGLVNLGLTVVMLFSILVNYGFHLNGPKRMALIKNDNDKKELFINEVITTRIILSVLLSSLIFALVRGLNLFSDYDTILVFSTIILLNEAFFPMFILQGLDRISWITYSNAISKVLYLALVFAFIKSPFEAVWVNFLFGGSALLGNLLLLYLIYRIEQITFRWSSISAIWKRLKDNFQFFLSTIAGHISIHGGLAILGSVVSDFELGQYSLAQRVAMLLRMVPIFIVQSILQNASRLYKLDKQSFDHYLTKTYRIGLIVTFILGVVVAAFSGFIIRVVGGEYIEYSSKVLRILAFIPFFSSLNNKNITIILTAEYKDVLAKATWVTALFMVITSIYAARYFGGIGLSYALLSTELIGFIVHLVLLRKRR